MSIVVASVVNDLISLMMLDKVFAAKLRRTGGLLEKVHAGEMTIEEARETLRTDGPDALDKYLSDTE